jgi:type IV pilus assembly protein PilM
MLGYVQNLFNQRPNPIGIDFGSDCLRAAQVQEIEGDHALLAAAAVDLPVGTHLNNESRFEFFAGGIRELLGGAPFRGRQVILALPACVTQVRHVSISAGQGDSIKAGVLRELAGKLPFDPSHALIRHIVAGEITREAGRQLEVIALAAERTWVDRLLKIATAAKLDVVGMNAEPLAIADCFSHVYRRDEDCQATQLFLDMGNHSTRAVVARGGNILFARTISVGGSDLTNAVAHSMQISLAEARTLRIRIASLRDDRSADEDSVEFDRPSQATAELRMQLSRVEQAIRPVIDLLISQIDFCRNDHETTFPAAKIDRIIFLGGEARHTSMCKQIARHLDLPGRVGSPFCRMASHTKVGPEAGIDRRTPQPAWAVSLGLSMGPRVRREVLA